MPVTAPRPKTARTLRALARRSPATSSIVVAGWRAAAWATWPAGRACRCLGSTTVLSATSVPPGGSRIGRGSELACIAGLLSGAGDSGEVQIGSGRNGCGHGALDERGVDEPDLRSVVPRVGVGQQCPGTQHGTAQVRDEQDAVSGVSRRDGRGDPVGTGAEPAVVGTSGRYDPGAAGDLADEFGGAFGEAAAVGDEDDAYHDWSTVPLSRMKIGYAEGAVVTRAVDRAVRMLLALASGTPRLGVSEISELVDVPKPTVYTMLRTLERHGLVVQEVGGGKYALGPAVLQLGNAYLDGSELRARSAAWADRLARPTGAAGRGGVPA